MSIGTKRDAVATIAALRKWLSGQLNGIDVEISELDAPAQGNSNETISFRAEWDEGSTRRDERLILRSKTEGFDLFTGMAADVMLQWRMMNAVRTAAPDIPLPPLYWAEDDPAVLGQPFYVMGEVKGRVPTDRPPYHEGGWVAEELTPGERTKLWNNGLDVMADLHRLDWRDGFGFLDIDGQGAPTFARYLDWIDEWYAWARAGRPQPVMDIAIKRIHANVPTEIDLSVLWGDSRIGNIMFADDMSVAAVLDWEMAALGPAEVDLGWWLFMDRLASEARDLPRLAGFPDRVETIERYERRLGRPVRDLDYYELLGGVRMAIVVIRYADVCVQHGLLPASTTVGTDNPATKIVARILGLPEPDLSPEVGNNRPLVADT